jgi:hypothetical protein
MKNLELAKKELKGAIVADACRTGDALENIVAALMGLAERSVRERLSICNFRIWMARDVGYRMYLRLILQMFSPRMIGTLCAGVFQKRHLACAQLGVVDEDYI